jgi:hypothetical protein
MFYVCLRTYVGREAADGREEELNIGSSDEFGVHSSGVFEEGPSQ